MPKTEKDNCLLCNKIITLGKSNNTSEIDSGLTESNTKTNIEKTNYVTKITLERYMIKTGLQC